MDLSILNKQTKQAARVKFEIERITYWTKEAE